MGQPVQRRPPPLTHSCAPMSGTASSVMLSGETITVRPVLQPGVIQTVGDRGHEGARGGAQSVRQTLSDCWGVRQWYEGCFPAYRPGRVGAAASYEGDTQPIRTGRGTTMPSPSSGRAGGRAYYRPSLLPSLHGSALHVMLGCRCCAMVDQKRVPLQRRSTARHHEAVGQGPALPHAFATPLEEACGSRHTSLHMVSTDCATRGEERPAHPWNGYDDARCAEHCPQTDPAPAPGSLHHGDSEQRAARTGTAACAWLRRAPV